MDYVAKKERFALIHPMGNLPPITIVTAVKNQARFIEETIRSVISQDYPNLEYIVLDGGSHDGTKEIVEKYEGSMAFYRSHRDGGQRSAITEGFLVSTGDILGFLNGDDILADDALACISRCDWENDDLIYGEGMWIDENGNDICLYPTMKPTYVSLSICCPLCQPAVFFKRSVFEQLNGFSEEFENAFDYDFWWRAYLRGFRFGYTNRVLAKSRMHRDNKTFSQRESCARESRLVHEKHVGKSLGLRMLLRMARIIIGLRHGRRDLIMRERVFGKSGQTDSRSATCQ